MRYNGYLRAEILVEVEACTLGHTLSDVEAGHLSTPWLKHKQ